MSQSDQRRKLHSLCDQLTFTRDERIELAQYLLRRDITSYSQLSEEQVCRLLDALDGFHLVVQLLSMRTNA